MCILWFTGFTDWQVSVMSFRPRTFAPCWLFTGVDSGARGRFCDATSDEEEVLPLINLIAAFRGALTVDSIAAFWQK